MAAGATYEPIATQTLGSAAATITFSSIAASWTDLRIIVSGTSSSGAGAMQMIYNNDTGTNYSRTWLSGSGSSASSGRSTTPNINALVIAGGNTGMSATVPVLGIVDIFSYAGSTYKTMLSMQPSDKNGSGAISAWNGLWLNTAAITRIDINLSNAANMDAGTIATIYGIKAA